MDDVPVRVLSIQQPWAYLIAHAGKDIENRTWSTGFRGIVLMQAGQRVDQVALNAPSLAGLLGGAVLRRGGIVGAFLLVDVVQYSISPWFAGPYGFVLRAAQGLPFVPSPGALGLRLPSPAVLAATRPHLAELRRAALAHHAQPG